MKTLECDQCGAKFTILDDGCKFCMYTFCSTECLTAYCIENSEPLYEDDFDGEDDDDEDDEVVNDYDTQMGYAND